MRHLFLSFLVFYLFSCKKKHDNVIPKADCQIPTEIKFVNENEGNISMRLVGTDTASIGKVSWRIISAEKTLQIETTGKVSITENFTKSGDFKVIAIVETECDQRVTLTRSESIQIDNSKSAWTLNLEDKVDTLSVLIGTPDGGCIVAGTKHTDGSSKQVTVISRINSSGNITWVREMSIGERVKYSSIIKTSDGNYLIGGTMGHHQYFGIVKITPEGTKLWDKIFITNGDGTNDFAKVINTSDGGYLLAGSSSSVKGGDKSENPRGVTTWGYYQPDYWVIKVNSLGTRLWDKNVGGDSSEILSGVVGTNDGDYVLWGFSHSTQSGDKTEFIGENAHTWIIKLNKNGVKDWDRAFSFKPSYSPSKNAVVQSDGSILLAPGGTNLLKINQNGKTVFSKTMPNQGKDLILSSEGKIVWTGVSDWYENEKSILNLSPDGSIEKEIPLSMEGNVYFLPENNGIYMIDLARTIISKIP